ncbi:hypothetical protein PF010_g27127 [Phytophthora fragariae]|uniref:Secreted protein n=1 Tax=Phytophthora fragariae TaxID=53985 RepID=A0A6A3QNK6_9STRA|nr:hypothetical protein PF009_g7752 [Phytophthora fragariae]KAE9068272.1 hypothetical protein PF010_g27127 [Phytophthora fragariae]KAE9080143.1 hypothetical protein PF006_g27374 [Phytophthora fragariae]KAE9276474.1 hypothetical protein PF001_g26112 [Phytophthora fragariae]KAE9283369.1 hypothetical protein PF008_g27425 [Phytophthora fragariae]
MVCECLMLTLVVAVTRVVVRRVDGEMQAVPPRSWCVTTTAGWVASTSTTNFECRCTVCSCATRPTSTTKPYFWVCWIWRW